MQSSGMGLGGLGGGGSATAQQAKQPRRRCAEVCLELMCIESVRFFNERQSGPAAAAALEAVGFRVGRQLAERYEAPGVCFEE